MKEGRFDRNGLILGDNQIFFKDIFDTQHYNDKVVITLYPFATVAKEVTDYIMPGTFSLGLHIRDLAEAVEYGIDSKISKNQYDNHLKGMSQQEKKKARKTQCPHCSSTVNLTSIPDTANVYCEYCDNIFDRNRMLKFNSEHYQVCPECDYYGRVQDYHEFLLSFKGYKSRRHFCCDTCALRIYKRTFWWNLFPFFFVSFYSYGQYLKSLKGKNPYLEGLAKANMSAQDGKLVKADEEYTGILTKNFGHPGIHYNYGVATLRAGNPDRAAREFQIALQNCANYTPVIKMMQKHKDLIIPDPSDNTIEIWDVA